MKERNIGTLLLSSTPPKSTANDQKEHDYWLNLNELKNRLLNIAENLHNLPNESLKHLWNVAEQLEIVKSLNLADDDEVLFSTPSAPNSPATPLANHPLATPPATPPLVVSHIRQHLLTNQPLATPPATPPMAVSERHGKRWEVEETRELERMLRQDDISLDEIAKHFGRTRNSIELKASAQIDIKINSGCALETALHCYRHKICRSVLQNYIKLKERDEYRKLMSKRKRKDGEI